MESMRHIVFAVAPTPQPIRLVKLGTNRCLPDRSSVTIPGIALG